MSSHILPKGFKRAIAYTFSDAANMIRTKPEVSKNQEKVANLLEGIADGLRVAIKAQSTRQFKQN